MSFAFAVYSLVWISLLAVSWHPVGAFLWMAWTVAPFVLADGL